MGCVVEVIVVHGVEEGGGATVVLGLEVWGEGAVV